MLGLKILLHGVWSKSKLMTKSLAALTFIVSWQASAAVSEQCEKGWACYSVKESKDTVEFWVLNKKELPFTATIGVETENLQSENSNGNYHDATSVIQRYERKLLLKLYRKNAYQGFHYSSNFFDWAPGKYTAIHDDYAYLKPFAPDARYRLIQGFNGGYSHFGASRYAVDFAMPIGSPVHAARGGVVVDAVERHNKRGESQRFAKYANYIVVLHSDGTTGEYYHLKQNGVAVEIGEKVTAGQYIGLSGNTGFSSMPHLHFAVYRAKSYGNFESLPFKFKAASN
jgi:murein DD-endopeptidase MepM/ murein hydrolase activator NlpD